MILVLVLSTQYSAVVRSTSIEAASEGHLLLGRPRYSCKGYTVLMNWPTSPIRWTSSRSIHAPCCCHHLPNITSEQEALGKYPSSIAPVQKLVIGLLLFETTQHRLCRVSFLLLPSQPISATYCWFPTTLGLTPRDNNVCRHGRRIGYVRSEFPDVFLHFGSS